MILWGTTVFHSVPTVAKLKGIVPLKWFVEPIMIQLPNIVFPENFVRHVILILNAVMLRINVFRATVEKNTVPLSVIPR